MQMSTALLRLLKRHIINVGINKKEGIRISSSSSRERLIHLFPKRNILTVSCQKCQDGIGEPKGESIEWIRLLLLLLGWLVGYLGLG